MVKGLARIEIVCANARAMAVFYGAAFGFLESSQPSVVKAGDQRSVRMRLGRQEIALVDIEPQGRSYPADIAGWNPLFQHVAIVASDMARAYDRLLAVPGWTSISTSGPQVLPAASGGVSAFKFRDPEGHPLELIAFPAHTIPAQWQTHSDTKCLGIDHSAISVTNTAKSVAFYESLGLNRSGGSLNTGPEQAELDNISNAVVEVTALTPTQSTPHVELLSYQGDFERHGQQHKNDATATRLVFAVENRATLDKLCVRHRNNLITGPTEGDDHAQSALLRDPDGHLICLEIQA